MEKDLAYFFPYPNFFSASIFFSLLPYDVPIIIIWYGLQSSLFIVEMKQKKTFLHF